MQRPASAHTIISRAPCVRRHPSGRVRPAPSGHHQSPWIRRGLAATIRRTHGVAVLCALALLPACGETQAQEAGTEAVRSEITRIEGALAEIESRALRDPELRQQDQVLGEALMDAMIEADPGLPAAARSLTHLRERHQGAVRAGDADAARDLGLRIQAIEQRYLRAQADALQQPSLAERVDRFNTLLRRRMIQTDDAAERLLRRYAELRGMLGT
jgi:major membrane immunogen (membrane-anchored lipoprotein)